MRGAVVVVVFLSILPRYAAQLLTTDAKCLSGYDWVSIPFQDLINHSWMPFLAGQFNRSESLWHRCRACRCLCRWSCVILLISWLLLELTQMIFLEFNLSPLDPGYVYLGPSTANANTCRCSSVYYSLLSACAYCQGRNSIGYILYLELVRPHSIAVLSGGRHTALTVQLFMWRCQFVHIACCCPTTNPALASLNKFQLVSRFQLMPIRTSR